MSVSVDQETTVDIKLQVGQLSETVEVTGGSTPEDRAQRRGDDVQREDRREPADSEPPLHGVRVLTPGVQATTSQTASSEDPQGSYRKVVNGQSFAGSSHLLDGTDNHDALLGLIVINPTLESLTEAKITTANYDAEFGATAGVISAQTKSGTNDLRGALSYFLRDDIFMARNPFTQFQPIPGPGILTRWNQFGGALGGPIAKQNLFFFADYQGTRRTPAGRRCCACPRRRNARAISRAGLDIFDPTSGATPAERAQFQGNRIPTGACRLRPRTCSADSTPQHQRHRKISPTTSAPGRSGSTRIS